MGRGKGGLRLVVMNKSGTRAPEIDERYRDDNDNYLAYQRYSMHNHFKFDVNGGVWVPKPVGISRNKD